MVFILPVKLELILKDDSTKIDGALCEVGRLPEEKERKLLLKFGGA